MMAARAQKMIFRTAAVAALASAVSLASALAEEVPVVPAPAAAEPSAAEPEKFFTLRTEFFSVSAESPDAAQAAGTLAREIEDYFLKNSHRWAALLPPQGVRAGVELFSRPDVFRATRDADGRVALYVSEKPVPGDDVRSVRVLRFALARTLLLQMLASRGAARPSVPAWVAAAVAEESRVLGSPARGIFLARESRAAPSFPPTKILAGTDEDFERDAALRLNALWLLRAVPDVAVFLDAGKTDGEKLLAAFPRAFAEKKFDSSAAEKFWAVRFREMLRRAPAGVDSTEDSRRAFDELLLFSVSCDGADARVLASELISCRADADVRELAAGRLAALAARFRQVNPVWHNAFAEYGVFLEMFPNPDVSDETLAAQWEKTLLARGNALALQREVRAALDADSVDD